MYHYIGTKNRTVLRRRPLGAVDVQALPPFGWCQSCGGEVYRRGLDRCSRCTAFPIRGKVEIDS